MVTPDVPLWGPGNGHLPSDLEHCGVEHRGGKGATSCASSSPPYGGPGLGRVPTSRKVGGTCVSRPLVRERTHLPPGVQESACGPGEEDVLVCDNEANTLHTAGGLEVPRLPGEGTPKSQGGWWTQEGLQAEWRCSWGKTGPESSPCGIMDLRRSNGQAQSQRPSKTHLGTAAGRTRDPTCLREAPGNGTHTHAPKNSLHKQSNSQKFIKAICHCFITGAFFL